MSIGDISLNLRKNVDLKTIHFGDNDRYSGRVAFLTRAGQYYPRLLTAIPSNTIEEITMDIVIDRPEEWDLLNWSAMERVLSRLEYPRLQRLCVKVDVMMDQGGGEMEYMEHRIRAAMETDLSKHMRDILELEVW